LTLQIQIFIFVVDWSTNYMAKKNIKQLILEKGAEIMHMKGFYNTGIQEITKAAKVPKGSFYFYFESKDFFGIELINYYSEHLFNDLNTYLDDNNYSYIKRLYNFFNFHLEQFFINEFKGGCPLGNFALELADTKKLFEEALKLIFANAIQQISETLQKAIENNEIENIHDPDELAQFIFYSWEGIIMQMKTFKNRQALNNFNNIIFEKLLNYTL